jgi:hypothetical protein
MKRPVRVGALIVAAGSLAAAGLLRRHRPPYDTQRFADELYDLLVARATLHKLYKINSTNPDELAEAIHAGFLPRGVTRDQTFEEVRPLVEGLAEVISDDALRAAAMTDDDKLLLLILELLEKNGELPYWAGRIIGTPEGGFERIYVFRAELSKRAH